MNPYGIRLGTPALTTRGMKEQDIIFVAELIHKGILFVLIFKQFFNISIKNFRFEFGFGCSKSVWSKIGKFQIYSYNKSKFY